MASRLLKSILMGLLMLCFGGLFYLGIDLYRLFYQPMIGRHEPTTLVRLDNATSATAFVRTLSAQHLIHSKRLFLYLIRMQGLAPQLKAGIYQVNPGESAQHFLCRVVAGEILIESFPMIEGTTQSQISTRLARAPYLTYKDSDWQVVAPANAEGLLLADTYYYNAGSSSRDLLARAHANLEQYLDVSWAHRAPGLPYKKPYDLLVVASILEKETARPDEKRLISGVIVNRLRKYMPLQMDPTVIYGLGNAYTGKLTHENLQVDSPYNTYRYRGLPPTPIAMVGRDAIDAAAHPTLTDDLYFVAIGDGTHCFSSTYEQQKQAITRYLRKGE
ncbi:MAG TPA: endolytic transglycosylase MltG [Legionella sp.]|nr:endolytic transglycosylase MltG [Legionella sp.]